jgi:hypothetical protein
MLGLLDGAFEYTRLHLIMQSLLFLDEFGGRAACCNDL